MIGRLIVAAYFVDAGLLLAVAPWTRLWDVNAFAVMYPWLDLWMTSQTVRWSVAAIGVVTGAAGLREVVGVFASQARASEVDAGRSE